MKVFSKSNHMWPRQLTTIYLIVTELPYSNIAPSRGRNPSYLSIACSLRRTILFDHIHLSVVDGQTYIIDSLQNVTVLYEGTVCTVYRGWGSARTRCMFSHHTSTRFWPCSWPGVSVWHWPTSHASESPVSHTIRQCTRAIANSYRTQ